MLSACSTLRTIGLPSFAMSESDRLFVRAEDRLQRAADLADGRIGLHCVHRDRHHVAAVARRSRERLEGPGDRGGIAPGTDLLESSYLLVRLLAAIRVE